MQNGYVAITQPKSGLAEITFFHPKHNSLPGNILAELAQAIRDMGADDQTRVILLKSGGDRTFCAGASFEELIAIQDKDAGKQFFMGFANVINALRTCTKIVVGRVQGKAVGGGVGVAASVDYCLASKYAAVKLSELNIGIGPFVVGPAVQRKVGLSAFSQMTLNANEFYSAEWAKDKGLYAEVLDSAEALEEAVDNLTDYLLAANPQALSMLKEVFWEGCENWDDLLEKRAEKSGLLVLSEFTKDTLAKYATT
ncbi:MAG: enoyl-CoA hydratase/isomerase family protein [Bacteroidota bacterium]